MVGVKQWQWMTQDVKRVVEKYDAATQ